jgi:hypothetical protein
LAGLYYFQTEIAVAITISLIPLVLFDYILLSKEGRFTTYMLAGFVLLWYSYYEFRIAIIPIFVGAFILASAVRAVQGFFVAKVWSKRREVGKGTPIRFDGDGGMVGGESPPSRWTVEQRRFEIPLWERLRDYLHHLLPGWPPDVMELLRVFFAAALFFMIVIHDEMLCAILLPFVLLILLIDFLVGHTPGTLLDACLFVMTPFTSYLWISHYFGKETGATSMLVYFGVMALLVLFCPSVRKFAGIKTAWNWIA